MPSVHDIKARFDSYQNNPFRHPFTCGGGGGPCSGVSLEFNSVTTSELEMRCPTCGRTQILSGEFYQMIASFEPYEPSLDGLDEEIDDLFDQSAWPDERRAVRETPSDYLLRKRIWLSHVCVQEAGSLALLYGDDGELQCTTCRIDFRRDSVELIDSKLTLLELARGQRVLAAPPKPDPVVEALQARIVALKKAAANVLYRVGEWRKDLQRQAFDEEIVGTDCGTALRELRIAAGVYLDEKGYPTVDL